MTKRHRAANATALPADGLNDFNGPDRRAMLTSAGAAALIAATGPAAATAAATPFTDPDAALWALRSHYLAARVAQAVERLAQGVVPLSGVLPQQG